MLLDSVIAFILGGDHHKEPAPHTPTPKIELIAEFVFTNELRVVHHLFPDKEGIKGPHNLAFEPKYLATSRDLDSKLNLAIVKALEEGAGALAKREGFKAIIGLNASRVTQHVANSKGYQRFETIQVNTWVNKDGIRPFAKAADHVVMTIDYMWL